MRLVWGGIAAASISVLACFAATQTCARTFNYQAALGRPTFVFGSTPIYAPFSVLTWSERWSANYPRAFALPRLFVFVGFLSSAMLVLLALKSPHPSQRPFGAKSWGGRKDAREAGLFAEGGIVIGKFDGEILAYDGPHHLLLTGGTRSGKTRGSVIPTLLACPHSILVLDLKGELHSGDTRVDFPGTAGWRARLGPVIRFAPTEAISDRLNLLDTIRPGAQEVRDVQNLVELIADPYGDGRFQEFWDRAAKQILAGLIIHVVYAEPLPSKTLARVFELLARFDDTVKLMEATLHRKNEASGEPETHPEVKRAAHSYAAYHEKLRAGIKATAESYLGLFADPLVRQNTATSTFRISDLMCADEPVTLYLCWPPNDAKRVKPLIRLVFGAVLRVLMEHQERAADGREKKRNLLLLLDEFPQLGKLDVFEQSMGAMAGYGLKAYLVTQSLHQVTQAYGRYHTILDNCQIVTSFAATDVETAETISKLAGDIFEMRPQETWSGKRQFFGLDHRAITYREERRPLLLSSEVRRLSEGEELIFVTGAKPLRAQKLRYDEEPVFRMRLLPAPEEARRRALPSPWTGISSLGFAQRRAPDAPPGRDGAINRALTQKTPLRSRPAPEQQQGDLLSALEANRPDHSGEVDPSSAAQPTLPASSRFALRPPSEDSAGEAGS
ncbi:type IV secretory system conjugative DNA transfer family protein [Vitreimonas sp.]|uniref:type IV secretory system conjugative DNA transfer family protein n=1 Tax=Vitreimonas sp. TaxID=3069702 RepID=UPI002EDA4536